MQKFKNWTNICFLLPLGLAFYYELHIYTAILALVVFISFMYHQTGDYRFRFLDHFIAYVLIASNLFYVWKGDFNFSAIGTVIFFTFFALYFKFKKVTDEKEYIHNHGYWHIISSFVTVYCLMNYVLTQSISLFS